MGTEAQQALARPTARYGGGGARNQEGTRQAQAQALKRSKTTASSGGKRGPTKRDVRNAEWDANANQQRADFKKDGYGGMRYGPTAAPNAEGGRALQRTRERADPGLLLRDVVGAMQGPQTVRATGNIYDDPRYAAMANEHGADFALRARNLQRKLDMARQTQGVLNESMANQFGREQMRRDNARDQMAFQQQAEVYGTPGQVSQAYTGGQRAPDGSIVRPGARQTDPRTGLAVDESGAFTGQRMQDQTVAPVPQPPEQPSPTPQDQAKLIESYAKILEDRRTPDDVRTMILQQLQQSLSGQQPPSQPRSAQEVRQKILEKNPGADPNSEEFQSLYRSALQRFGLSE